MRKKEEKANRYKWTLQKIEKQKPKTEEIERKKSMRLQNKKKLKTE